MVNASTLTIFHKSNYASDRDPQFCVVSDSLSFVTMGRWSIIRVAKTSIFVTTAFFMANVLYNTRSTYQNYKSMNSKDLLDQFPDDKDDIEAMVRSWIRGSTRRKKSEPTSRFWDLVNRTNSLEMMFDGKPPLQLWRPGNETGTLSSRDDDRVLAQLIWGMEAKILEQRSGKPYNVKFLAQSSDKL